MPAKTDARDKHNQDVQTALAFIELLAHDEKLRDKVSGLLWERNLGALCALARTQGYRFCEHSLRRAFALDWHVRRLQREPHAS